MDYMDELRFFWNLVWHPGKYAGRQLDFAAALRLYYTLAILPFLAYVLLGSIAVATGASMHSYGTNSFLTPILSAVKSVSYLSVFWGGIALFFILLPLGIAIDALVYQVIAKFFLNIWKGTYEKTLTALMFGLFPLLMLLWLSVFPIFNTLFIIVAPIWSLIVIVISLSAQQKVARLTALLAMVIKSGLVLLVFLLIGLSIFASLAYVIGNLIPLGSVGPLSNITSGWLGGHGIGIVPFNMSH